MYMHRLDQFDATPIAGTNGIFQPHFSPDGEWVAFGRLGNKLEKISLKAAAAPIALFDSGKDPILGAHWATDGTILIATREHGLRRVSAEGGEASVVTTLSKDSLEICHHSPVLLPGGRAVLFTVHEGVEQFSIAVQSLVSGERKVLIKSGFDAQYSPSGHLVFANGSAILAVPFDVPGLKVTGPAVTLVENVATAPNDGFGNFRISQSGALVYQPAQSRTGRTLTWVDRSGAETPLTITPRAFANPRLSPDGKRLAFAAADGDRQDIWIYEIASDRLMRLTTEGINQVPLWTRDGKWLTYSSIRGDTKAVQRLLHQPVDGSQPPEVLLERTNKVHPGGWTPDGRTLFYMDTPPTDLSDMRALRLDGGRRSEPVTQKPAGAMERHPRVSPDGRWLAYDVREGPGPRGVEVFVQPVATSGLCRQVSVEGGREPIWSRDGRELFFRTGRRIFAVPVDTTRGFTVGKPVMLFERPYLVDLLTGFDYDVAPDGRFLMIKPSEDEQAPARLNVVLNWVKS
jgi:serine/threonine-protein kinase